MDEIIRIAVLGDSISEGLGSKKYNYIEPLKQALNQKGYAVEIKNFSKTGTTIDYPLQIKDSIIEYSPNFILILYGNVEAIIRPNIYKKNLITLLLPKRYRKMFMLDNRPFYSQNIIKNVAQHLDSLYRYVMRKIISLFNGTYRLMEPEIFEKKYSELISNLKKRDNRILCVSNVRVDDFYFPKSSKSLDEFRRKIIEVTAMNDVDYVPLYDWQCNFSWKEIYASDHYHPSQSGYKLMGEFFANEIKKIIELSMV